VKNGVIEIQGDHRDVVVQMLEAEGYRPVPCRRVMRVDKWLWTARLFKTRALAAEAVKGGRVHVNGVAVKPGREVRPGDELELALGPVRRTVIVRGATERRVSAAEVANLYDETEESVAERERQAELRRLTGPVDLGGRPTKRDRRRFDAGPH
jgi:ribosome-associated heat shock protein Hsp15